MRISTSLRGAISNFGGILVYHETGIFGGVRLGCWLMFSIGQIFGESFYQDDFRERFNGLEGSVAIDLDERFTGWEMEILQSVAI